MRKATVTSEMDSACARNDGGSTASGTTLGVAVSLTEISTRIAFVAGLALVALLVIGWRKTAKDSLRAPVDGFETGGAETGIEYLTGSDVRRLAAGKLLRVLGLGAIAVLIGIVLSLGASLSVSWLVTNILDRL